MSEHAHERTVAEHYGRPDLAGMILGALRASGVDTDALGVDDLAPIDQFHTGGKPATLVLARLAGLQAGMRVLDVGGGIGGPARTIAAEYGCHVTVLDLTEEFCRVGALLTARTGLSDHVSFRHGSALAMEFDDASFDVVWTQHSSMNIEDKQRLYAEAHRVLRSGGLLALHEVMAGPAGAPHFPVPWADEPSISFLRSPDEVRALLAGLGFKERVWLDTTASAAEAMRGAPAPAGPPHIVLLTRGPEEGRAILANYRRSVEEGRVTVIQAVLERP